MSHTQPTQPHRPHHDVPEERELPELPVEPDEGLIPPHIPDDPEHDRLVDPAAAWPHKGTLSAESPRSVAVFHATGRRIRSLPITIDKLIGA